MKNNILQNRMISWVVCITVIFSVCFSVINPVNASGSAAEFYVSAELPDNQADENVTYFDLRMEPKDEQTIYVKIYNEKKEEIKISIYAANASSNSNGIIDYTIKDVADKSLKHPFEKIAEPLNDTVIIPAESSKKVGIKLTMPEDEFNGIILGGLVFTEVRDDEVKENKSVSVDNVISYAVAVKLSETDKVIHPEFDLLKIEPRTVDYEPVITHYISNEAPVLSTKMIMTIEVRDAESGIVVATTKNDNVSMAPNSVMPYSLRAKDAELDAGDYISKVKIEYKDEKGEFKTVAFEKGFSITKEQEKETKEYNSVGETAPTWAKTLIISAIALTIAIIVLIIVLIIKRKKNVQHIK